MAVAENRLGSQQVADGLQRHAVGWPAELLFYNDMRGIPELRAAVARMLARTSMRVRGRCASPHAPACVRSMWHGMRGLQAAPRRSTCNGTRVLSRARTHSWVLLLPAAGPAG
jgi:hypothetical protein